MAQRQAKGDGQQRAFDMRSLLRLGLWGTAASAALALTVIAAYSTAGSQRLQVAMSQSTGERPSASPPAQLEGRAAEIANETQRLSEAVRALATDRDRLLTRIATLERGLEDITGATRRQPAPPSPEAPPIAAGAVPPSGVAQPLISGPDTLAPAAGPNPSPTMPQAAAPPPATRVANAPVLDPLPEAEPAKPGPELGVDVGGATSFEGLRVLWNSTKRANSTLFDGLNPLVVVRESKTHGVDLRLIAGPLADQEAAARLCTTLSAARRHCQPAPFEGQQFTRAAPEPERRPATPPKPATPQQPRPPVR